jgi:hypothetical protein
MTTTAEALTTKIPLKKAKSMVNEHSKSSQPS